MLNMQAEEIAVRLITAGLENGGGTFPATQYEREPSTGYAVAYDGGLELAYSYGRHGSLPAVRKFVRDNLATVVFHADHYFGVWAHNGRFYFDVTKVHSERAQADEFARTQRQIAIYNLATGETIYTPTVSLAKARINYVHPNR